MPQRLFTNPLFGGAISNSALRRRHGIVTGTAPGLTAANSFQAEPASVKNSVRLDRFQKIRGTSRFESATQAGSTHPGQKRGDRALISADENSNEREHQAARIKARFARRNHSSSNSR